LVKSSGRVATFNPWTGVFWDGISFIPGKTRSSLPRLCEQGLPREDEDDCWVGEAVVLHITASYTLITN